MGPPPRVKQLEIILYWQKLQDKNRRSVKAIKPRKLGPAQTTYFLFSKPAWQHVRMCTGRLFGGQRGIWSKDVPPRCLFRRISWLRDVRTHMGRSWDMPNTDSEPGKSCPSPGDLPDPGIEPLCLPCQQAGSLPLEPPGKPLCHYIFVQTHRMDHIRA